jgi:hypothetical protein
VTKRLTVLPAYGRDYQTAAAARADWDASKDFIVADYFDPYDGKYINKQDADRGSIKVQLRFRNQTQICWAEGRQPRD